MNNWKTILFEWLDWSWKSTISEELEKNIDNSIEVKLSDSQLYHKKNEIIEHDFENILPFFIKVCLEVDAIINFNINKWKIVLLERNIISIIAYFWSLWINLSSLDNISFLKPDFNVFKTTLGQLTNYRGNVVYGRDGQKVFRELVIFHILLKTSKNFARKLNSSI